MNGRPAERRDPEISLIIPAHNEADGLLDTVAAARERLAEAARSWEIILVDDGSTDDTWALIRSLAQADPAVRGIRLSRNFGKEAAISAGLERARGEAAIVMDADLQHPPALLGAMIRAWRDGAEIVDAVKTSPGSDSRLKALGSRAFAALLSRFTGHDLRGDSDFKLLDRKVLEAWRAMPEAATYFRGMTHWMGFRRERLPFDVPRRASGTSRWNVWKLTSLAVGAIVSYTSFPLRIVSAFGLLFLIGAVLLGAQTLARKLSGDAVTGFTTVILLLLLIGSILMVSLGIIGEYIAAIYHEVKRRPRYLISSTAGEGEERSRTGTGVEHERHRAHSGS
jgi:glycosyltransferase involved in cell wall biosynthesis